MSTYQALYRKWRPRNFGELVGQEHVARTLSNAITGNKLAHAYLFTGPRGTGKTSSARIFAKSLNCAAGLTVTPCETCPACVGITRGNFPDVFEMDAASHRGVDDARDLRERVRFAPTQGRYKVFIIDEVHMLTNEAFNALLKTIEEPPPNLVFILATTDVHKVPATIISRCQRFDFQRIGFKLLYGHLEHISRLEGFTVEGAGLEALSKRAEGGLRDALSLLDQVRAGAAGDVVTAKDVMNALGIVSNDTVSQIVRAIADNQIVPALEGIHALLNAGYDPHAIIREFVEFFRHLMLVKLDPERALMLDIPESQLGGLKALVERFRETELLFALEVFRESENHLKHSNQLTVWLEIAVIRLAHRAEMTSVAELAKRVAALEDRLAHNPIPPRSKPSQVQAAPPPAPPPAPAMVAAQPAPGSVAPTPPVPLETEVLPKFLATLSTVHRSTGSLLEQHALWGTLEHRVLTIAIKSTMQTFFDKMDRKAHIDKAAVQAFGPGIQTVLTFESGDTPRPRVAGALPPPATPPSEPPVLPRPESATRVVPAHPAEPPAVAPPVSLPTAPEPPQEAPPLPAPPVSNLDGHLDLLARAVDIFNGRVIEPTA